MLEEGGWPLRSLTVRVYSNFRRNRSDPRLLSTKGTGGIGGHKVALEHLFLFTYSIDACGAVVQVV